MSWTNPSELNWVAGSPLTAEEMNTYVKDNLLALRALNVEQTLHKPSATISTNSTVFVDADPSNLKVDIEISSDRLLCIASFLERRDGAGTSYYDLIVNVDGSTDARAGDASTGLKIADYMIDIKEISFIGFWTGLQPGIKTVKLQMRSSNTNYAQILATNSVILTAIEV